MNCPRCGYDQRGQAATWREACPLEGVCTECGLRFEWADIFVPERNEPPWCIEHVRRRAIPHGCAGTFIRSFLPWRFWNRLRLSHVIRSRRLLVYVLLIGIAPLLTPYVAAQTFVAVKVRSQLEDYLIRAYNNAVISLPLYEHARAEWETVRNLDDAIAARAVPTFGYDQNRKVPEEFASQEEWDRAWQYTASHYDTMIDGFRKTASAEPRIDISYAGAVVEAVLFPTSETSRGTKEIDGERQPYYAPNTLYEVYWWQRIMVGKARPGPARLRAGPPDLYGMAGSVLATLGIITIFLIQFPATFILLPMTRRRAKVKWMHFGRITAYSVFIPATIYAVNVGSIASQMWLGNLTIQALNAQRVLLLPIALVMALLWWYFAIRSHLRLPHAFWLLAVMSFLTLLILGISMGYAQLVMEFIAYVVIKTFE